MSFTGNGKKTSQPSSTDPHRTRSLHQVAEDSESYRRPEAVDSGLTTTGGGQQPADLSHQSYPISAETYRTNSTGPRTVSEYLSSRDGSDMEENHSLSHLIVSLQSGDFVKSLPKNVDEGALIGAGDDQFSLPQPHALQGPATVIRSQSELQQRDHPTPSPRHSRSLNDIERGSIRVITTTAAPPAPAAPAMTRSPGSTTSHSTLTSEHTIVHEPRTVIEPQNIYASHPAAGFMNNPNTQGVPRGGGEHVHQPGYPGPAYGPHFPYWQYPPYMYPAGPYMQPGYPPPHYPHGPYQTEVYSPHAPTQQAFRSVQQKPTPPKPAPRKAPSTLGSQSDGYEVPSPLYESPDDLYEMPIPSGNPDPRIVASQTGPDRSQSSNPTTPPPVPTRPRPKNSYVNVGSTQSGFADVRPKEYSIGGTPVTASDQKKKQLAVKGPPPSGGDLMSGALLEKEAMKQFRLAFQKASLKERSGNMEEALEEYNMALYYEIQARGETNVEVAKTHKVVAALCRKANKSKQSVEHLEQALSICARCGFDTSTDLLWTLHDDLAQSYSNVDPFREMENYKKAISILTSATDVPPARLAHMYNNLGNCYRRTKQYDLAETHLTRSKEMMVLINIDMESDDLAKVHKSLADLYKEQGKMDKAIQEYKATLKIYAKSVKQGMGRVLSGPIHNALAEIYDQFGDGEKAAEHRRKGGINTGDLTLEDQSALAELARKAGVSVGLTPNAQELADKAQVCQRDGNIQMAITHYKNAIAEVEKLPERQMNEETLTQLAMLHNNVGNAYRAVSRLHDAKTHIQKALEIRRRVYADEPCDATATALFNLGYVYSNLTGIENQVESMNLHRECLEMYMKLGGTKKNSKWIIALYRSLASNCYNLGEINGSIENYEKAREVINAHGGDLIQLQAVCNNVGNSYKAAKKYKEAEENLQSALSLATVMRDENPQNLELENDIASAQNNLGCLYQEMGNYDKAVNHHLISLDIRERIAPDYAEAATDLPSSLHNIANAYSSAGMLNDALKYYDKEVKVRKGLGDDTQEVYLSMAALYQRKNDLAKAEECLALAH